MRSLILKAALISAISFSMCTKQHGVKDMQNNAGTVAIKSKAYFAQLMLVEMHQSLLTRTKANLAQADYNN